MASDTGIVNRALRLLKAQRITALTDGSKNANVANDVFVEVREDLLRAHKWNFAKKRQKLAKLAAVPVSGFDNAFGLPSDWLRTILVSDNDADAGPPPIYSEEEQDDQGVIATAVDELWLSYVYRLTDPNRMAADFRTAFAYALAVAMPGIGNMGVTDQERLQIQSSRRLRMAKSSDAMGSSPERRPRGSWASVRGGWRDRVWPS